jgi:hypothetical protein
VERYAAVPTNYARSHCSRPSRRSHSASLRCLLIENGGSDLRLDLEK